MPKGYQHSADTRARIAAGLAVPAVREARRAKLRAVWTPEKREAARQVALAAVDPAMRETISVRTKEAMRRDDVVRRVKETWADPAHRSKHGEAIRTAMADPAMPARIRLGMAAAALRRREQALWFLLGLAVLVTGAVNTMRAYGYKGRPGRPPLPLAAVLEALGPPLAALVEAPSGTPVFRSGDPQ
jgi:hypothetical protein